MTRVLLTGAGGFVGSHVLEVLLDHTDWGVVAIDSFVHNGTTDRLYDARRPARVLPHDLTVPFSPRQLDAIGKLDYIIHVASRCSVAESIDDPSGFVRNNIDSTLTVLELARAQWCWEGSDVRLPDHRLIHLSTDEVYGPGPSQSYTDHRPSSPYAASKAAQEDLVHAWGRTYGVPAAIYNSANMFGERQSQLAFIPRVIAAVLDGRSIPIHTWQDEPGRRRYTYVRNTAQAIVDYLALASPASRGATTRARVPLPGQCEVDNLDLAKRIAGLIGRKLRYTLVPAEVERPGYDPAYSKLGGGGPWAKVSFEDGLERTVKWYVDHPEWLK